MPHQPTIFKPLCLLLDASPLDYSNLTVTLSLTFLFHLYIFFFPLFPTSPLLFLQPFIYFSFFHAFFYKFDILFPSQFIFFSHIKRRLLSLSLSLKNFFFPFGGFLFFLVLFGLIIFSLSYAFGLILVWIST